MVSLAAAGFFLFCLIFLLGLIMLLRASSRSKGKRFTLIGLVGTISSLVIVGVYAPPPDPAEVTARANEQAAVDIAARAEAAEADRAEAARIAEETRMAEAAEADERRSGFHCLSPWDGSHEDFKALVKSLMRNPSSFEHIQTRINPVDADGNHTIIMDYRAENGFGGMNVNVATATVSNSTCAATPLVIE